jgi:hypothetical protein
MLIGGNNSLPQLNPRTKANQSPEAPPPLTDRDYVSVSLKHEYRSESMLPVARQVSAGGTKERHLSLPPRKFTSQVIGKREEGIESLCVSYSKARLLTYGAIDILGWIIL